MSNSVHLHFVCEGRWWGFASGVDHNDEDHDEEESKDRAHHSSGHGDGVWPLCLRLVWDRGQRKVQDTTNNTTMTDH